MPGSITVAFAANWHLGQFSSDLGKVCQAKNLRESQIFLFYGNANQGYIHLHPVPLRGRRPSLPTRDGLRWTLECRKRAACERTAKTCGPDAPDVGVDGGNSTWLPGEITL